MTKRNHSGNLKPTYNQMERYARFVKKGKGKDACWVWTGYRLPNGYGQFRCGKVKIGAHRFIWIVFVGPIPEGMMICHTCDNPPCCRLDHLFLGTAKDNSRDMMNKNRNSPMVGPANPRAKLSSADVLAIRARAAEGERDKVLAAAFHVDRSYVNRIVRREARAAV